MICQDTSRDVRYKAPAAAVAAHVNMLTLKGVRFQPAGGMEGAGWAAVMWERTDREGGDLPPGFPRALATWALCPTVCGISVLEIRDGTIARETICCDHLRTRY